MTKPKVTHEDRHDQNPMIGDTQSDTIRGVLGALQWLSAADEVIEDSFGGEPTDSIKRGRWLLGECCIEALRALEYELDMEREAAEKETSHD